MSRAVVLGRPLSGQFDSEPPAWRKALVVAALPVALFLAVAVQLTVVNRLPLPGGTAPDLVLLLVAAVAVSTSPTTATVQLATDASATVGIRMAGNGQIGALSGTANDFSGTAPLKLTLFNANATLKPGQELVTFGSVGGRPYVPGIPIGTITSVTTQPGSLTPTALVKPFADFTGLGVLGVVVSK